MGDKKTVTNIVEKWTNVQNSTNFFTFHLQYFGMYLRAWNTQQSIAGEVGVDKKTLANIVEKFQERKNSTDLAGSSL